MPGTGTWNFPPKFRIKSTAQAGTKSMISVFTLVPGGDQWMSRAESRAEQYRRYAAECVRLASLTDDTLEKGVLLQMAEQWQQLAAHADKDKREA
jgi:hypothetical protein